MNPLTNLLSVSQVLLDFDASSKKRVFEQAGMLFENHLGLARSVVFDSLFAREKLGSTGLGQGIAIPHGRIKGLKQAAGAFLRLATPVPFDSPDGRPVNLLFVLLVPEAATDEHLELLRQIASMLDRADIRERLRQAADSQALYQIVVDAQNGL